MVVGGVAIHALLSIVRIVTYMDTRASILDAELAGQSVRLSPTAVQVTLLQLICFTVCAAIFLGWFYVVYRNLGALRVGPLASTPGRAVLSFFVPCANLIWIYQRVREAAAHSAARADPELPFPPVRAWWFTYIGAGAVAAIGGSGNATPGVRVQQSYDELGSALLWDCAGQTVSIGAALLCAQVVLRISAAQDDAAKRRSKRRKKRQRKRASTRAAAPE